jgi:hypothetical protein
VAAAVSQNWHLPRHRLPEQVPLWQVDESIWEELVELAEEARADAARDARSFEPATLAHLIAVSDAVLRAVKQSGAPRTLFDAAVVRMALAARFAPVGEAAAGGSAVGAPPGLPAKKAPRPM